MHRNAGAGLTRAVLFDRLTDDDPFSSSELEPVRTHDRDALIESVGAELSRLLNTRRATSSYLKTPTVIDYGVPDWSALYADRAEDRKHLAWDIRLAIGYFEPRLTQVNVTVDPIDTRRQALRVRISGVLQAGNVRWPAVFVAELVEGSAGVGYVEE
ncbi:type VI secretion system baseplate subunit TssE [Andreprevotia chitinilytica]|uniref:type VI secretion system baseplate subunit TssE n=1 Tax=Andreprevotia chitinilytica TaxID=396808 RepID=UPI000552FD06|nr:type VI secretion system baseplate subunit TssE [Andreprevotia chitinilytica]